MTSNQFNLVYNAFSFAIAAMFASALFFLNAQAQVGAKYRLALLVSAIVVSITGYPGEISAVIKTRLIWGTVSTIPFCYILYVLWVELSKSLERQPADVQSLVRSMRLLLLLSWGVYPIAYLLPVFGIAGTSATVGVQVGYTIADVLAKPLFGLIVFAIALSKTKFDLDNSSKPSAASDAPELDVVPSPTNS